MALYRYVHPRSYTKEILADTPISYWPLDDFTASVGARDVMALHNGAYTGDGVTKNIAGPGRGLDLGIQLAGTDDGVLIGDFAEYEFAGDFTAECWFKQTSAVAAYLIGKRLGSGGEWALSVDNVGQITAAMQNTVAGFYLLATGGSFALNVWHHAAMVCSGTTLTVYMDGVAVASTNATTGTRNVGTTDPMAIGFNGNTTSDEFVGQITAAAVYASALTGARLLEHVKAAVVGGAGIDRVPYN